MKAIVYERLIEVQELASRADKLTEMLKELDHSDVHLIFGRIEHDQESDEEVIPEGTAKVRLNETLLDGSDPLTEDDLEKIQQAIRGVLLVRQMETENRIHSLLARDTDPADETPKTEPAAPEKPVSKPRKVREKPPELPLGDGKAGA